jgi:hypothetical protein
MFKVSASVAAIALLLVSSSVQAAVVFDDFNVNEGHFALAPNFSGSTSNTAATSTADRIADATAVEGDGFERIVYNASTAGAATRIRFLSGGGTPANNTTFSTGPGEDGWIGFYARTTSAGWNAQIWVEPSNVAPAAVGNNGSTQTNLIADGDWHLYEWNLDDTSGGAQGWQATGVPGIVGGLTTVGDGNHTIDSILFRHAAAPANGTIDFDFVARSDSGTIATLVPEPTTIGLFAMALPAMLRRRRR